MVRGKRLELLRLSAYAPQTYVSTNSTTCARHIWVAPKAQLMGYISCVLLEPEGETN